MKTFLLIPFLVFLFSNSLLIAKCYSFRKVDSVKICIDGDSNADRRKAQELCKKIIGSECGGVGCHFNVSGLGNGLALSEVA